MTNANADIYPCGMPSEIKVQLVARVCAELDARHISDQAAMVMVAAILHGYDPYRD